MAALQLRHRAMITSLAQRGRIEKCACRERKSLAFPNQCKNTTFLRRSGPPEVGGEYPAARGSEIVKFVTEVNLAS